MFLLKYLRKCLDENSSLKYFLENFTSKGKVRLKVCRESIFHVSIPEAPFTRTFKEPFWLTKSNWLDR